MSMTLPPSIRPYWSELTAEKAAAPAHRSWEYNPDPFAAKKEVADRQEKRKEKEEKDKEVTLSRESKTAKEAKGSGGRGWDDAPEVKMAASLREMVEGTVRKVSNKIYLFTGRS